MDRLGSLRDRQAPPGPLSLFSWEILYSSMMLPVLWDDGRNGSVWGEDAVRNDCSDGGPGGLGGASVEASDESSCGRCHYCYIFPV